MPDLSPDLLQKLAAHGQTHVLAGWERLDDDEPLRVYAALA